jgi:hypothetical protein
MPDHHLNPIVRDLIRKAEQAAATEPDMVGLLAALIRLIGDRDGDPYLLMGTLIEGAVQALAQHVPPERHTVTGLALVQLVTDRLLAHRLI